MNDTPTPLQSLVRYEVADRVATIRFVRPERRNALTREMEVRYLGLLAAADRDPNIGAIVVTGEGTAFCAGADVAMLDDPETLRDPSAFDAHARDTARHLDTPLVAAVNGDLAGIGLVHALMADVRFAAAGARWTTAFASLGLVAEWGSAWLLTRQVGPGRALDLLCSNRTFTSEEALNYGLAEFVHPAEELLPRAQDYAARMAANSTYSLRQIREQVRLDQERGWDAAFADSIRRAEESFGRDELGKRLRALRPPPAQPSDERG